MGARLEAGAVHGARVCEVAAERRERFLVHREYLVQGALRYVQRRQRCAQAGACEAEGVNRARSAAEVWQALGQFLTWGFGDTRTQASRNG